MILACHNLSKSFGDQVIVKDGSFHIENHEKAALVGINGAGKSTILKMIVGQLSPDAGTVVLTKGKTLGYLAQHQEMESGNTIYEEVRTAKAEVIEMEKQIRTIEIELPSLSGDALEARLATYQRLTSAFEHADGYAYKSELTGVLKGLGFTEEEFTKPVDSLSGGQKTRVSLGKLLLTKPDVLLLDEPTNHLDMNSIAWLETYLLNYPGAVLIVSHDRYFLNRVVTKVIEVEQGQLHTYMGNYSDFAVKKEQLREARLKEYLNQQREIKHQEAVIEKLRSFNREKSIKRAESREKMLDKMTLVDKPMEINTDIHLKLEPSRVSGNDVLSVKGLSKAFPPQTLFTDISFEIKRGEHIAIIGDNGTGKTTLLEILNNVIQADSGSFTLGANVEIGYYDQEHHVLHMDKTILEYRGDKNRQPWIEMRILPQEEHFTREEMRRVYQGIYIKEMTLFQGETLEYQIYERRESGAVLVKEGRAVCDLKSEGKDNSRFACLNQMSEALAQQDADGLLKAMEDYVKKSMVLGILFPVK